MSENTKKCVYQSRVFDMNLYNFSKILLNNSIFHIDSLTLFKWEQKIKNCSHKKWLLFSTSTQRGTKKSCQNLTLLWPWKNVPLMFPLSQILRTNFLSHGNKTTQWKQIWGVTKKSQNKLSYFSLFDIHKQVFFSIAITPP